jgi:hypothetical protein
MGNNATSAPLHSLVGQDLLPCPLCGEPPTRYPGCKINDHGDDDDVIECALCSCRVSGITMAVAECKWNHRVSLPNAEDQRAGPPAG